jgi:galactose mutarotase-like enzyme
MIKIQSSDLEVTVKTAGAELVSIRNKKGLEFLWQARKDVWPRHAPVLFPVVGRLKDDRYLTGDHQFSLSQHGFARDQEFQLVKQGKDFCTLLLSHTDETLLKFPFPFFLEITYSLSSNILKTTYKIKNPGDSTMPFSIGAHPGFRCPLSDNETFEDYYLEFENNDLQVTALNNGLRTSIKKSLPLHQNKLPLSTALFDNDALVFEGSQIDRISLASEKSSHKISMSCEGWPYFGIWTKKGNNEFICLEPWYGIADHEQHSGSLDTKEGMIRLGPGSDFEASFEISLA